jgi:hypothetical protein
MGAAILERQMRETRDPHRRGAWTAGMRILGYPRMRGRRWPYRSSLVVLRRRALYPTPGEWHECATADLAETVTANRAEHKHVANTAWQYAAVRVQGNGYESAASEPVRVDFDNAGDLINPRLPAWPLEVAATPIAGGEFRITWVYDPWGQGDWPADFAVYEGADAGSIDYDTIVGTVAFDPAAGEQVFTTSETYGDGTEHCFAVRGRNSSGVEEKNTITTAVVTARASGPAAATIRRAVQPRRGGGRE